MGKTKAQLYNEPFPEAEQNAVNTLVPQMFIL